MTTAYPLTWPDNVPRTRSREGSRFKTTLPAALANVRKSLEAFGRDSGKPVSGIILSSNVSLGQERPHDPGIAVWFAWEGMQICIPVDRYNTAEANLQAIHHVIEARRTELRHGTLHLVKATFRGFQALAPPADRKPWREVLGLQPATSQTRADIEAAHRKLAMDHHPDRGGDSSRMAEINDAKARALAEIA